MSKETNAAANDLNEKLQARNAERKLKHAALRELTIPGPAFIPMERAEAFGLYGDGPASSLELESVGVVAVRVPHETKEGKWAGYFVCQASWARDQVGPDDAKFL